MFIEDRFGNLLGRIFIFELGDNVFKVCFMLICLWWEVMNFIKGGLIIIVILIGFFFLFLRWNGSRRVNFLEIWVCNLFVRILLLNDFSGSLLMFFVEVIKLKFVWFFWKICVFVIRWFMNGILNRLLLMSFMRVCEGRLCLNFSKIENIFFFLGVLCMNIL